MLVKCLPSVRAVVRKQYWKAFARSYQLCVSTCRVHFDPFSSRFQVLAENRKITCSVRRIDEAANIYRGLFIRQGDIEEPLRERSCGDERDPRSTLL